MPLSAPFPQFNTQMHPLNNLTLPHTPQSSSYITSYFHILTTQNNTLKSQNNFLKSEITKLYQNERKILEKIQKLSEKIKILKYENQIYQDRYEYLKKYVIQIGSDEFNKKNQCKLQGIKKIKQNIKKIENFDIFNDNLKLSQNNKGNTVRVNKQNSIKPNNNNNKNKNISKHNQHSYQHKYQHSQLISPFYSDRIYEHHEQQDQTIYYQQQQNIKTNKHINNNIQNNQNQINHTPLILQSPNKSSLVKKNKMTKNSHNSLSMKLFQNIQNLSQNDQIYSEIPQIFTKNIYQNNGTHNLYTRNKNLLDRNTIINKIQQQIHKLTDQSQNLIEQYNKSGNNNKDIKKDYLNVKTNKIVTVQKMIITKIQKY